MADALLDVRRLSRRFAAVDALKAVDFSVQAGEIHALIGPNGAGKTTFIHHVSGALLPDSGSVHLLKKTNKKAPKRKKRARQKNIQNRV